MKLAQINEVTLAVKTNLELLKSSKGEALLVGLENFDKDQLAMFDSVYEHEAKKLSQKYNFSGV